MPASGSSILGRQVRARQGRMREGRMMFIALLTHHPGNGFPDRERSFPSFHALTPSRPSVVHKVDRALS
jgi:hypothetical protein